MQLLMWLFVALWLVQGVAEGPGSGWEESWAAGALAPPCWVWVWLGAMAAITPSERCPGMAPRCLTGVRFAVVRRFLDELGSNEWGNRDSKVCGWGEEGVVTHLTASCYPFETTIPRVTGAVPAPQPPRAVPLILQGP